MKKYIISLAAGWLINASAMDDNLKNVVNDLVKQLVEKDTLKKQQELQNRVVALQALNNELVSAQHSQSKQDDSLKQLRSFITLQDGTIEQLKTTIAQDERVLQQLHDQISVQNQLFAHVAQAPLITAGNSTLVTTNVNNNTIVENQKKKNKSREEKLNLNLECLSDLDDKKQLIVWTSNYTVISKKRCWNEWSIDQQCNLFVIFFKLKRTKVRIKNHYLFLKDEGLLKPFVRALSDEQFSTISSIIKSEVGEDLLLLRTKSLEAQASQIEKGQLLIVEEPKNKKKKLDKILEKLTDLNDQQQFIRWDSNLSSPANKIDCWKKWSVNEQLNLFMIFNKSSQPRLNTLCFFLQEHESLRDPFLKNLSDKQFNELCSMIHESFATDFRLLRQKDSEAPFSKVENVQSHNKRKANDQPDQQPRNKIPKLNDSATWHSAHPQVGGGIDSNNLRPENNLPAQQVDECMFSDKVARNVVDVLPQVANNASIAATKILDEKIIDASESELSDIVSKVNQTDVAQKTQNLKNKDELFKLFIASKKAFLLTEKNIELNENEAKDLAALKVLLPTELDILQKTVQGDTNKKILSKIMAHFKL